MRAFDAARNPFENLDDGAVVRARDHRRPARNQTLFAQDRVVLARECKQLVFMAGLGTVGDDGDNPHRYSTPRASAPPTISRSSFVIAAWRALFMAIVSSSMSLDALSVALVIATSCAAKNAASVSSIVE